MPQQAIDWLLASDEPWTRYRTLQDLLQRPHDDAEVRAARDAMLGHPLVQALIADVASWPGYPLKRHNDAAHPLHKLTLLADFGVRADDPGMAPAVAAVLAHRSEEGAFQSLVNVPKAFGGSGEDQWSWMLCDAPVLLSALLTLGLGQDARVQASAEHLAGLVDENGYRCLVAPELGRFRGPGRKADPCPIANVVALKALAHLPGLADGPAARTATEMLLQHWSRDVDRKLYMFGTGDRFRKLKAPFVWYDILHVADVLSRFPFARDDPRFRTMVAAITDQADEQGRYTAGSMYRAWKGWSFADKKHPSPWVTYLVLRMQKRLQAGKDTP
jgi:hypothetical protein